MYVRHKRLKYLGNIEYPIVKRKKMEGDNNGKNYL